MTDRSRRALSRAVNMGHVEMSATGEWQLTRAGRDFMDDLALLMELDNRGGTAQESRPWRTARPARPTPGSSAGVPGAGDERPRAQRAHGERT